MKLKRLLKIFLSGVGVLLGLIGGLIVFAVLRPATASEPSTETIERTPERLERGRYLVEHVTACGSCHSEVDRDLWSMPPQPGKNLAGGLCFDESRTWHEGFVVCAPNLTSDKETGLGDWTDGEVLRALREGVSRNGEAISGPMPWMHYRNMSDEDLRAMVVYLRSLPPVRNPVPERRIPTWINTLNKLTTGPMEKRVQQPDRNDRLAYGEYLVNAARCGSCHTPVNGFHIPLEGREFAGGQNFQLKGGVVRSANITPHPAGLGARTRESFIELVRMFGGLNTRVQPDRNTYMPWTFLAGMTDDDLGMIYDYLMSRPAIDNVVHKYPEEKVATPNQ